MTEMVVFKEEQPGIKQITLIEDGTKVLSISKPTNPTGTDVVRTTATVCVREIPSKLQSTQNKNIIITPIF